MGLGLRTDDTADIGGQFIAVANVGDGQLQIGRHHLRSLLDHGRTGHSRPAHEAEKIPPAEFQCVTLSSWSTTDCVKPAISARTSST